MMELSNDLYSMSASTNTTSSDIGTLSSQQSLKDSDVVNNTKNECEDQKADELNILVAVRCRGRTDREVNLKSPVVVSIPENDINDDLPANNKKIKEISLNLSDETGISAQLNSKKYTLDQVFGPDSSQEFVFTDIVKPLFYDFMKGFNCTILCYGMTSTGKTYTMTGDEKLYNGKLSSEAGIIPRVLFNLFEKLNDNQQKDDPYIDYLVKCSFIELYNEDLKDLLSADTNTNTEKKLKIYDSQNNVQSSNLVKNKSISDNNKRKETGYTSSSQRLFSMNNNKPPSAGNSAGYSRRAYSQTEISSKKAGLQRTSSNMENSFTSKNGSNNNKGIDFNSTGSGIFIQNLEEFEISEPVEGIKLLQRGLKKRKVATTKMNDVSSRSHSIFSITLYKRVRRNDLKDNLIINDKDDNSDLFRVSKINLVDLAGSENISRSGAIQQRAKEAGSINQSLLTLGRVINALSDLKTGDKPVNSHIPFRESKLTRLLQDSLGGNTKTALIATISPAKVHIEETVSTLEYASKAKNIKNKPQIGSVLFKDLLLKNVAIELSKLKNELHFTKQKEGGIFMESEKYDSFHRDLENFKIEIQEYKRLNANLKEQNRLLSVDKENLIDEKQKNERKIGDLTKLIDYIYEKMDKQHRNEENLVDNAKQLISAINLMKDSIDYYNNQKESQRDTLMEILQKIIPDIKNNINTQLQELGSSEAAIESHILDEFKENLRKNIEEIISKTNSACENSLNSILNSNNIIVADVRDKIESIGNLLKSHIELNTKDLMMISEYCNDCHDYLNDKIQNNLNFIKTDFPNGSSVSHIDSGNVLSDQVKALFMNLENKNKEMLHSISNNVQQQFKVQKQEILKSVMGISKDFYSIENEKLGPINTKIKSVISLINSSDYQNLSLSENCNSKLKDINSLVLDNKLLLEKKLREFSDSNSENSIKENEALLVNKVELLKGHILERTEKISNTKTENSKNLKTLDDLNIKINDLLYVGGDANDLQKQNEISLNQILASMENKNFRPVGSSGKTPMRPFHPPVKNPNGIGSSSIVNTNDHSSSQEKTRRSSVSKSVNDSENYSNDSNSSVLSVRKRKVSSAFKPVEEERRRKRKS